MAALLHIGTNDDAILADLRESGIEVRVASESTEAATSCDVVMIAPDVAAPLQVARRIHGDAPDTHIVFLTTPSTDHELRRELLVGRIGTQWSIAPADQPKAAAAAVRDALAGTARRRRFRTTLGRINMTLAAPAPAPPRRTLISDHFLASVLDQLSDAIVVLDPERNVLAHNEAAAQAFADLRRGAPFAEALPSAAREAILAAARAPKGRAESTFIALASGLEYGIRATSLRDADGRIIGTAVVARDMTARRREEERRALIADAVRELGSTLDVKESTQKLVDILVRDFADIAVTDIVEGDDICRYGVAARTPEQAELVERSRGFSVARNRDHPSLRAAMRGETVVRNDVDETLLRSIAANDEHLEILTRLHLRAFLVAPLRAGRRTVGALALARTDGTFSSEDVELVQELARQMTAALHNIWSYQSASEASRLKDEFLATLSHELRTPMTAILGWAQILRLDDSRQDLLRDGLESIERSARAQAQLIDDLLDLSRMQMGKLQFHPRPFSLTTVVRAAVDTVRPAAQARGVELIVDAPKDISIVGDPDRMQQVIWNLLSNAVKFSDAQTAVRINVGSDTRRAQVSVSDRGRGIAPEFLPHVFDRFRQADSATTRRFGGLGLGLAIVKQLVELHGGTVEAASPGIGRGATFTITLPLPLVSRPSSDEDAAAEPEPGPDLTGVHVLIVDDDLPTASVLAAMLKRAGAEVRTAHSATEALESVRAQLPHVLVSDVAMPDEDGLSLIRAIRGTLRIPADRLPAIALTAFTDVKLSVTVLGAGFQRFMTKPVDAEALAAAVAALVK